MKTANVLIKPVSGSCNMRCRYCFYCDEASKRAVTCHGVMSTETAFNIIHKTLDDADGDCTFAFQGGEPTLRGLEFYRQFVEEVRRHAPERQNIRYAIQTNGLLLDPEWASFLKEKAFLVGLSMDGGSEVHNLNRVDAQGKGTHSRVMRAARLLERAEVPFNVLTVVTSRAARSITSVYNFYKKNRLLYQQYIACLDPIFELRGQEAYSLSPDAYGDFLIQLFDLWYRDRQRGEFVYIHYFESLLGQLLGRAPVSCGMMGICSAQSVIEADGDVYPCDFYALDEYCLGNINTDSMAQLDEKRLPFLRESPGGLEKCQDCRHRMICHGGCRRDRQGPVGLGLNAFCESYLRFFDYAMPRLRQLLWDKGYRV